MNTPCQTTQSGWDSVEKGEDFFASAVASIDTEFLTGGTDQDRSGLLLNAAEPVACNDLTFPIAKHHYQPGTVFGNLLAGLTAFGDDFVYGISVGTKDSLTNYSAHHSRHTAEVEHPNARQFVEAATTTDRLVYPAGLLAAILTTDDDDGRTPSIVCQGHGPASINMLQRKVRRLFSSHQISFVWTPGGVTP